MNNLRKFYLEAEEYIKKGDLVQASEKLYKCSEEAVKSLARHFDLPTYKEAMNDGRWKPALLFRAATNLSEKTSREFMHWWNAGWALHTEGFHEMRMDMKTVKLYKESIKELLKTAETILDER